MEQSLVLTFDVGTQSARCLLVNESGDFEDKEQQKYKVPYLSKIQKPNILKIVT